MSLPARCGVYDACRGPRSRSVHLRWQVLGQTDWISVDRFQRPRRHLALAGPGRGESHAFFRRSSPPSTGQPSTGQPVDGPRRVLDVTLDECTDPLECTAWDDPSSDSTASSASRTATSRSKARPAPPATRRTAGPGNVPASDRRHGGGRARCQRQLRRVITRQGREVLIVGGHSIPPCGLTNAGDPEAVAGRSRGQPDRLAVR